MKDRKRQLKKMGIILITIPLILVCMYWLFFMIDSFVPKEPGYREYFCEEIENNQTYWYTGLKDNEKIIGLVRHFDCGIDNNLLITKENEYTDFHYQRATRFEHQFTYLKHDVHLTIFEQKNMYLQAEIYATIAIHYNDYVLQTSILPDIQKFFIYDKKTVKKEVEDYSKDICKRMITTFENEKQDIEKYLEKYIKD